MSCFCPKVKTCLSPREKNISQQQPYLCLQENSPWNTSLLKRCKTLIDSRSFALLGFWNPSKTCSVCSMEQNRCTCWGNQLGLAGNQTNSMMPWCLKKTHTKESDFFQSMRIQHPTISSLVQNLAGPTNKNNRISSTKTLPWGRSYQNNWISARLESHKSSTTPLSMGSTGSANIKSCMGFHSWQNEWQDNRLMQATVFFETFFFGGELGFFRTAMQFRNPEVIWWVEKNTGFQTTKNWS